MDMDICIRSQANSCGLPDKPVQKPTRLAESDAHITHTSCGPCDVFGHGEMFDFAPTPTTNYSENNLILEINNTEWYNCSHITIGQKRI